MAPEKSKEAEKQQDWIAAAESGDVKRLKLLVQGEGEWLSTDPVPQIVLCAAAKKNQEGALKVLLDWGTSVSSKDKAGQRPLHCAAGAGANDAVRLLLKRKADVNETDGLKKTPIVAALSGPHPGALKELLRAGATMPKDHEELPFGVLAVVKEVQLEKQMEELKTLKPEDKALVEKLAEADKQVWAAQRAHMQMLERHEEAKVAKAVQTLDERVKGMEAEAAEGKQLEDQLRDELNELKVKLQTEQNRQTQALEDIAGIQSTQDKQKAEEEALDKQLAEKQAELDKLNKDVKGEQEALEQAERDRDNFVAECDTLMANLDRTKLEHQQILSELALAAGELNGLRNDRRRVADLTSKAAELHHTVDSLDSD